jgi:hypothetical protein
MSGTTIYYIAELPAHKFHFFEKHDDAKEKEAELVEKYGYMKAQKLGISEAMDNLMATIPKYQIQYKTLKNYYGTVWLASKWDKNNTVSYVIHGRWKDIKHRKDDAGYEIKKFVLTPYDKYMKRFEVDDDVADTSGIPPTSLF